MGFNSISPTVKERERERSERERERGNPPTHDKERNKHIIMLISSLCGGGTLIGGLSTCKDYGGRFSEPFPACAFIIHHLHVLPVVFQLFACELICHTRPGQQSVSQSDYAGSRAFTSLGVTFGRMTRVFQFD